MKTVVAHHLGLKSPNECHVADISSWLHGSFNVCVPITVESWKGKRFLLRFPLPYRVGESFRPGNCDEKVQCEAGAYAWIQNNCPDVPFTRIESLSFIPRCFHLLRQNVLSWLNGFVPSHYAHHKNRCPFFTGSTMKVGYLLTEFIEERRGSMLSNTWKEGQHDPKLRKALFHDFARIFLNIIRIPLPRVGSFVIDLNESLRLTNRPLSIEIQQLEIENIPTEISRDYTYSTSDSYVIDVFGFHDNRFRYQPNTMNKLGDSAYQLSVLTAMRTIFQSIIDRGFCRGPFVFVFPDLHQSNIFVITEWHFTCLVGLEWACTQPIEILGPPSWLSDKGVDQLIPAEYDTIRQEFMEALKIEEQNIESVAPVDLGTSHPRLSHIMERSWEKGASWYSLALSSPSGLLTIFTIHIKPLFCKEFDEEFAMVMPFFFKRTSQAFSEN
ncbi:hypothetical protein BDW42DRAFT_185843 [Aspergillus taichungensis]|uniref:Aminoglycoside phosphotransferase domain-containing protein n=1 Tax=Aspergillus taichungensis TaxID=482145 RepID=A0A2J5HTZ7_9EURO|nr:hypothetical protein BDW42DRAFT_185843 [Aspergillus taichungensis]